jgi:hypothetical protein
MTTEIADIKLTEILMWCALLLSQIADVWTTQRGLKRGAQEANPVVRKLMSATGDLWGGIKVVVVMTLLWYVYTPGLEWLIWLGAGATTLVAINNYRIVK